MRPSIGAAPRPDRRLARSARHFIDRFFPGDYKVIPNGVDIGRFDRAVPDRALAGRHEEHPVRRPVRGAQGPPRPPEGVPDPAQDRLRLPAAGRRRRAAGEGGPALPRDPQARRRRVPRPRQRRGAGRALQDRRRVLLAGHGARIVRHRAARGDGRRYGDRRQRHPRLQGRASGAASRACSCRRASRRRSPARSRSSSPTTEMREAMGRAGRAARPGVQLGAGDRQGRGLLRLRDPAPRGPGPAAVGLPRPDPAVARQAPALAATAGVPRRAG